MPDVNIEKLYDLAGDEVVKLAEELYNLKHYLTEQYEIKDFLTDYTKEEPARRGVLLRLLKNASPLLKELVTVLGEDFLREFSSITEGLVSLVEERKNVKFVKITTAFPLEPEELEKIAGTCGVKVKYNVVVDPELLGGFIINYADSRVFDGGIRGQLLKLRMEIMK